MKLFLLPTDAFVSNVDNRVKSERNRSKVETDYICFAGLHSFFDVAKIPLLVTQSDDSDFQNVSLLVFAEFYPFLGINSDRDNRETNM